MSSKQEDTVIFFVYRGDQIERWFADLKDAVDFTILNGLVLERLHLKPDGSIHRMLLYTHTKSEVEYFDMGESSL